MRQTGTSIAGVLHVDKPAGPTSHDVVNIVRRLTGIRRIGHSGTLDPLASGLLLLCLGRATRLVEYLVGLDKGYLAELHLGVETDTFDREGKIIHEKPVDITIREIKRALLQFQGEITQLPPMYSAVKIDGQPLYKQARLGKTVVRKVRKVTVHNILLMDWHSPFLKLQIDCSSGTYIRSLAHDLGQILGCGAHLSRLRRTVIGQIKVEDSVPLDLLDKASWRQYLQPLDSAALILPKLVLDAADAQRVSAGQPIAIAQNPLPPEDSLVRAYDSDGLFVGILVSNQARWRPRKIFYQAEG